MCKMTLIIVSIPSLWDVEIINWGNAWQMCYFGVRHFLSPQYINISVRKFTVYAWEDENLSNINSTHIVKTVIIDSIQLIKIFLKYSFHIFSIILIYSFHFIFRIKTNICYLIPFISFNLTFLQACVVWQFVKSILYYLISFFHAIFIKI